MNYGDYNDDFMVQVGALGGEAEPSLPRFTSLDTSNTTSLEIDDSNSTVSYEPPVDLASMELFVGYSAPLLTLATASCLLFMLVGIPGNLITIIALFRCKKVRNATAVFIINLSVSDLMSCCFNLPLAASTFWQRAWRHGILLCRLFPLLRYGLLAVSLFTVLAITINRYVMIGHPTLYPKLYKKRYLGLMVGATWVCGFGALVATWFGRWGKFGLDQRIGSCSILPDQSNRSPKEFLFLVAFVIPCLSIVVCYARIFYIVRKTAVKSRASNNARGAAPKTYPRRMVGRWEADSAVGSSTGPSYSTEKSSSVTEVTDSSVHRSVHIQLAPPRVIPDPSSSSGVEEYSPPGSPRPRSGLAAVLRPRLSRLSPRRHSVPPQPGKMTAKDKKLLKMILVIFASFVTCYLPITISKTFRDKVELKALNIAGYILIYLTTCINPIIYVVMSSEYRQAYKNLLMCRSPDSQLNTASKP